MRACSARREKGSPGVARLPVTRVGHYIEGFLRSLRQRRGVARGAGRCQVAVPWGTGRVPPVLLGQNHIGRGSTVKKLSIVSPALVALVGSAVGLYAAESETFTGAATASGTYKRPKLLVDGKRYELKASDKADPSVTKMLAKFSKGDAGTYVVKGTRGTVNGADGIIIDSIALARAIPGTGASANEVAVLARTLLAVGDDVRIVRSFPGNKGPGWKDSIDVAGAVGPRHVVDFDVAGFVVHDKANGKILRQLSTREFWQRVEPAGKLVPQKDANDARMLYDPLSERWFACAAGTTEADCFLAVSTSSDPTKPWRGAKLPLPRINPYMRIGVDRNGLYVCSCNGNSDLNKGTNCYVIPKRDVLADRGPVLTRAQTFKDLQFSTMPAMDPDADKPADAPGILLANEFMKGTCSRLYLYKITWSGSKASISDGQTIQLSRKYLTPNNSTPQMEAFQPKPGPKLRAGGGGRRIDSAFVRKGSVFGCNGAVRKPGSRPGVLWYEVRIRDGRLIQEGFVDSPDRDFIFPSVAVDGEGNVGIGCTGTSGAEFPSVYVMMHPAADPAGTMRRPAAAVPGTTSYHYAGARAVNLSHYSTTCVDPSDPGLLWTRQAYSDSDKDRQWCTAWAAFQMPDGKRPTPGKSSVTLPSDHGQKPKAVDSAGHNTFTGTATRSGAYR